METPREKHLREKFERQQRITEACLAWMVLMGLGLAGVIWYRLPCSCP